MRERPRRRPRVLNGGEAEREQMSAQQLVTLMRGQERVRSNSKIRSSSKRESVNGEVL